jgi:hypothetical protein
MTANAPTSIRSASIAMGCVASVLAGCAATPAPAARPNPAAVANAPAKAFEALWKGMTAAAVRELVGEPAETRPFNAGGLDGQVWVYHRTVSDTTNLVAVGTQEVPSIASGPAKLIGTQEPIYQSETVVVAETIELLMIDDRLIEWKQSRQAKRSFN